MALLYWLLLAASCVVWVVGPHDLALWLLLTAVLQRIDMLASDRQNRRNGQS